MNSQEDPTKLFSDLVELDKGSTKQGDVIIENGHFTQNQIALVCREVLKSLLDGRKVQFNF